MESNNPTEGKHTYKEKTQETHIGTEYKYFHTQNAHKHKTKAIIYMQRPIQ